MRYINEAIAYHLNFIIDKFFRKVGMIILTSMYYTEDLFMLEKLFTWGLIWETTAYYYGYPIKYPRCIYSEY